jgi:hypothetical protein
MKCSMQEPKKMKEVRWNSEEMLAGYQIERQYLLGL